MTAAPERIDYDPVCLHKGGETYAGRTGTVCRSCGMIRHRHSDLVLVPVMQARGITAYTNDVVPRRYPG